jgi:hypothetical protein
VHTLAVLIPVALAAPLAGRSDLASWRTIARLKWRCRHAPRSRIPGLVFVQIDGLSEPVLRQALDAGAMPTLARWLRDGTHRLAPWEAGLPSETSASQAGILHGNNWDIPGFRWFEKERAHLMGSGVPADAEVYNRRISDGRGLLHAGGLSIGNNVDGDAPRAVATISRVRCPDAAGGYPGRRVEAEVTAILGEPQVKAFLTDGVGVLQAMLHTGWELLVEVGEGWRQRLQGVQPRVGRGGVYPLLRAVTTGLMADLGAYTLLAAMLQGLPTAYVDFIAYDEVAHHAGAQSRDAMRVLRVLDRQIARLERAARLAPRPYRFVVLADHGQSPGATFQQRYGQTLSELVQGLVADHQRIAPTPGGSEALGHINALLTHLTRGDHPLSRAGRRVLRARMRVGHVDVTPPSHVHPRDVDRVAAEVVVGVSGNRAHIYFARMPGRLSYEEIEDRFPGVIASLAGHPGIGFVLVHSRADGPLVLGGAGRRYLASGRVDGTDPLAPFGPRAAAHLQRLDAFPHTGDLVVNSVYDPQTGEVAAFEELIGSHGGLGGWQNQPFLLYPTDYPALCTPLIGAEAVHAVVRPWVERTQAASARGEVRA